MRQINALIILMFTCVSQLLYASSQPVIEPIMVTLPSGEFLMGSEANHSEQPVHKVKVQGFQLAKYNVTVKEFLLFIQATHYKQTSGCLITEDKNAYEILAPWGALNASHGEFIPINCVSWKDTQAYIAWLNAQTGKHYRLPSEAEWEYAAGAGSNKQFHFGNNEKQLCQYENVYDATALINVGRDSQWPEQAIKCDDGEDKLSTVGIYQPNPFGLYDMLGNTSEWVEDCYHPNYQGAPKTSDAWLTKDCTVQFARGGSWATNSNYLRSSFRPSADAIKITTAERFYDRGFRLASDSDDTNMLSEQQRTFVADLAKAQQAAIALSRFAANKREALLEEYKTWKKSPVFIPPMVTIPSGEFLMGSNASKKEQPIHKVSVKSFKMSKYEVTIKQFKQFAAATGYITNDTCWKYVTEGGGKFKVGYDVAPGNWLTPEYSPSDYHPVMCVSWDDANAYLSWLSKQTGKKYRLPTEAEWEYAARAGSTGKYFFGDDDKDLCQYGNIFDASGMRAFIRDKHYQQKEMACDDGTEYTGVVGMYKPNALGLYDMIGNVSEWVKDCDHQNYEDAPTDGSAWISEKCFMRSRKGSSYGPGNSHLSMRGHGGQGNRSSLGEGFRIVEDISPASNEYKAISNTNNQFETELYKVQKMERKKRNQVLN